MSTPSNTASICGNSVRSNSDVNLSESQDSICNDFQVDNENLVKSETNSCLDTKLNEKHMSTHDELLNTTPSQSNDCTSKNNEKNHLATNCYETNLQSQYVRNMTSELLTDTEQISAFDKNLCKSINVKEEDSENNLETVISVFGNNNFESNKARSQEIEQVDSQNKSSTKSFFSYNDNSCNTKISTKTFVDNACSVNVDPIPNNFEMVKKGALDNTNKPAEYTLPPLDNSIVISNSNALPQSDSIVSSNYSLNQLQSYGSDESLHEESYKVTNSYRKTNNEVDMCDKDSDSDSSSSSSSSIILTSESSDLDSECEFENVNAAISKPIKAKGELDLNDLPPIEDLTISVPEQDCIPVGHVYQIVNQLVVIQALKDTPALNLDTVLFLQEGKPLGKIFDVFGPVAEPYYCVRFNSRDQIEEKNISLNQTVYCAPKTKYTNYVFVAQLLNLRGSDASWENDLEPPEEYLEYSDDEQEQRAKKKTTRNRKIAAKKKHLDPDEPARKKHFSYEKKMNKKNLQLTAARKKYDSRKLQSPWGHSSRSSGFPAATNCYTFPNTPHQMFGRPPTFSAGVTHGNGGFFPPRPNMFPSGSNMFQPSLDVFSTRSYSSRPDMIPPTSNMLFPPRPDMFPPRPNMFLSRPNMFPPRLDMIPHRPDMIPPRPDMIPHRPDMIPPRPDMIPHRPDMIPPRPDMVPPRPNMNPPRPDMIPPRPNMTPPRPDMIPPRPNMTPPRPNITPPRHNMILSRPDMIPPRSDIFSSSLNIFRPMMPPNNNTNISGQNNLQQPPLNTFQISPLRCSVPNTSTHLSQTAQPRIFQGPSSNAFSPRPGPSRLHYDGGHSQWPYSNHPMPSTGNIWAYPSSSTPGASPQSFWPHSQQNS